MSPTFEALGLGKLSADERVALAEELLESVAAEEVVPPLTDAQKRELERRLEDHRNNPGDVIPWERIKAEALARFEAK